MLWLAQEPFVQRRVMAWPPEHEGAAPQARPFDLGAQVPPLPVQAWHSGQDAEPQQKPSTQWPDMQAESTPQAVPLVRLERQVPDGRGLSQNAPAMQSDVPAQLVLQVPALQA